MFGPIRAQGADAWLVIAALAASAGALAGCGDTVIVPTGGGGAGEQPAGGGGDGGSGAIGGDPATGGTGGIGGDPATGGTGGIGGDPATGGMGGGDPCSQDCSTVVTAQCSEAVCDVPSGLCIVVPSTDGTVCDDGLFCTANDECDAGMCGGESNECGLDPDQCAQVSCNEAAQTCTLTAAPSGIACTTGDLCDLNTTCQSGVCIGQPNPCFGPPPGPCQLLACNPSNGLCEAQNAQDNTQCFDMCSITPGICQQGACTGGLPVDCSFVGDGCNAGICDPQLGCVQQPVGPGQPCPEATDDCNTGACDGMGSCLGTPTNDGNACDDGNGCTTGETCSAGVCAGGTSSQTIYFQENFADDGGGWSLEPEWEIGSAMMSFGSNPNCGFFDPGTDHSPGVDNGVAGVVIGGNADLALHPFLYLTSPPIDVSAAPGSVNMGFWRWLNSDYEPYMVNVIEVWDGAAWQVVWQTGAAPGIADDAWVQQLFDITAYQNAALQVRFGFSIGDDGVYVCSGWNIDDFIIADVVCP